MDNNVIEFYMDFVDVVFPINFGPLTYRCPEIFSGIAKPGMIVSAQLKNKTAKGILLGKSLAVPSGDIKDIQSFQGVEPVLSSGMIDLLKWMSDYYIAEQGLVLKNMLPREAFTQVRKRKTKIPFHPTVSKERWKEDILNIAQISNSALTSLIKSLNKDMYKTFLLHAPSSFSEYSLVIKILSDTGNAIILAPEVSLVDNLYPILCEKFGERVCIFHSDLSRGKRSETMEKILAGYSDIVVGTRSAVFAPLRKVSLIVVMHEHSTSYKQENSPCYNGRDVAVMRGYLEKATVLLSSICPSVESLYNCKSGKYTLLRPSDDMKKPRIKVIDMRYEKHVRPYLSKTVIDASLKQMKNDGKIMFVLNRRGYSTLLQCIDCNYILECPDCRIPLVFHKQDMSMKCHYCGFTLSHVPENCGRCRGYNLTMLGTGTQKLQEDLEEILGIKTLRFDSDRARKKSELKDLIWATSGKDNKIVICTKFMTGKLDIMDRFSMAAILNTDLFLNIPDFRSAEKAYQEISTIIDKIASDGEIFIQTRMPQNYLFRSLKNYNYLSFLKEELHRRKALNYPPYSRLLLIKYISKKDLSNKLASLKIANDNLEILGPYVAKKPQGGNEFKFLLKSSVRGKLQIAARSFIGAFRDSKDVRIRVDVDPVVI